MPKSFYLVTFILIMNMSECSTAQTKNIEPNDSSKNVIETVKDYSEKDNFFSRLVRKFLVQDNEIQPGSTIHDADKKIIKKYTGKIIRKINVEVLDVFGASVNNPQDTVRNWLQDNGNSLHMKTKEWLIKNKLIFNEGERLTPFDIQESERIIRQTSYVYDVRIIPQKIKNNADSVDIMVYTQDIWSINGSVLYHPGNKTGNVSFDDINFLGFGNDFKGGLKFD